MAATNASSFHINMLHEYVESIDGTDNLLSILKAIRIPTNKIKDFINQQIDELDANSSKHTYYTQIPIDRILSADIFQYILSFAGFYHTKAVNTEWKQYSEKTEAHYLTKLYKPINNSYVNTYIVHKYRKKLHEIEIDLGFQGPLNDIEQQCNSGGRLLIWNGVYPLSAKYLCDNLQLIGIENEVTIKSPAIDIDDESWLDIQPAVECNIQNIKLDCSDVLAASSGCISVPESSTLNMKNCELQFGKAFGCWARNNSQVNVNNCRFSNREPGDSKTAIELSQHAGEINIIDCIFKNCNLKIDDVWDDELDDEIMELKCIGNIFDFDDNLCNDLYPIMDASVTTKYENSNRYTIQNNVFKRQNNKNDPNRIY
eukprot:471293_1